jgi:two-component system, cell cycle response regulator
MTGRMVRRFSSQLWFSALAGSVVAYLAAALVLADDNSLKVAFRSYVHSGLMLAAAVVVVRSAMTARRERAAWSFMAVALVAYAAGEIAWRAFYAADPEPPFPSWADAAWLATYPAFYVGTMLLVRSRLAVLSPSAWLDGVIGAVVAVAVGVGCYLEPVLRATDGDPVGVAVTMAYPLGDVLLVALMVAVLALSGGRMSRSWALLVLGQAAIAIGDVFYALATAHGTYVEGRWLDVLWPIGVLLIAWASRLPAPARRLVRLHGWRAFALPAGFGAAAIAIELVEDLVGWPLSVQLLAKLALALVVVRTLLTVRENLALVEHTERQAFTDELTGMHNRRALLEDLQRAIDEPERPRALTLFDLDGFKDYNDSFGHGAGDDLLARLGRALASLTSGRGRAYRLGGDEFCLLADAGADRDHGAELLTSGLAALSEAGDGFRISASAGTVVVPVEASDVSAALKLADDRMYRSKASSRASAERRTREALLAVLGERDPALRERLAEISGWAWTVALRLGLPETEAEAVSRATELHDVGKTAVPDGILDKPGPLTPDEWAIVHQHPVVGERILRRAPALARAAALVRASHERHDGAGYPDGLAGEDIPLGARIVAVSDAFAGMTAERAWRPSYTPREALAELQRCAGSQFDPRVVAAFCAVAEAHLMTPPAVPVARA